MRSNVSELERVLLRQVVMRDVSQRDPSVEILGQHLALPVILGPVGLGGMMARRAEVQAARRSGKLHIDRIGIALIALGLGCLEVVLDRGQEDDWFGSHLITMSPSHRRLGVTESMRRCFAHRPKAPAQGHLDRSVEPDG